MLCGGMVTGVKGRNKPAFNFWRKIMSTVTKLNQGEFAAAVLNASEPVVVDFWAEWCGPCKMLGPVLDQIASETEGVKIVKVNVDDNPDLASQYRVSAIPTLLYFSKGEVKEQSVGAVSKKAILSKIEALKAA